MFLFCGHLVEWISMIPGFERIFMEHFGIKRLTESFTRLGTNIKYQLNQHWIQNQAAHPLLFLTKKIAESLNRSKTFRKSLFLTLMRPSWPIITSITKCDYNCPGRSSNADLCIKCEAASHSLVDTLYLTPLS